MMDIIEAVKVISGEIVLVEEQGSICSNAIRGMVYDRDSMYCDLEP